MSVKLDFLSDYPLKWQGEVGEYLRGERREFSGEVMDDVKNNITDTEFQRAVWLEMMKIPYGEVRSYGQIAEAIGRPRAVRAVGTACGKNKWPIIIPCHRVVGSNGLGGFALGLDVKKELLALERDVLEAEKLEKVYEDILQSEVWNGWMEAINNLDTEGWEVLMCDHGRGHTERVVRYARDFLREVGASRVEVRLGEIAALLHDVGNVRGREGHAEASYEMVREYLGEFDMSDEYKGMILHAVRDHSGGKSMGTLVDAAVLLGDKQDVTKSRVREGVELNELCRELLKVHDVRFTITDKVARLEYTTDAEFRVGILRFWWKCVSMPEKVARFIGREFELWVNGEKQDMEKVRALAEG